MNVQILLVELEGEYIDRVTYFDEARQVKTLDLSELSLHAAKFSGQRLEEALEVFENVLKGGFYYV